MNEVAMDYLASGFKNVDESLNRSTYLNCLNLLNSLEFFKEYKQHSYDLLQLREGQRVLDVGSGLGDDAMALAKAVTSSGTVVGVDSSLEMVNHATSRAKDFAFDNVEYKKADAYALPFDDCHFDRVRIDRTLQHISDPARAIDEMKRVLKPEGLITVFDNDWETFTISSRNHGVTRRIANFWCDSFSSGWVGRYLRKYLRQSGFVNIQVFPKILVVDKLWLADKVFDLFQTIQRARATEIIREDESTELLAELKAQDERDEFFCSYTGFLVVAKNPG